VKRFFIPEVQPALLPTSPKWVPPMRGLNRYQGYRLLKDAGWFNFPYILRADDPATHRLIGRMTHAELRRFLNESGYVLDVRGGLVHLPATGGIAGCGNNQLLNLDACGWPNSANTGPTGRNALGGALKYGDLTSSGYFDTTSNGQLIDGYDFAAAGAQVVNIYNNSVTFSRSRITITPPNSGRAAITTRPGVSGLVVQDVEINGGDPPNAASGYNGSGVGTIGAIDSWTVRRCNIYNYSVAMGGAASSTNATFIDNYCHDYSPEIAPDSPHDEPILISGGSTYIVRHNTLLILNQQTAAVFIQASASGGRTIDDVTIDNNIMDGGSHTIYDVGDTVWPTNVKVTNNRFGRHFLFDLFVKDAGANPITQSANVWDDTGVAVVL
jgi:hypothetical protein